MKSITSFALFLAAVVSYTSVKSQMFIGSPHENHWQRALDPPTDCANANAGDKVTDTSDCHNFYMCLGTDNMLPDSYSCGSNFLCFDDVTGECSIDSTACETACAKTTATCKRECSSEKNLGENIADPTDCNKHYLCLGGPTDGKIELYCPDERPHFNGKECVNNKAQCCTCQVEECIQAGQLLPDPKDCHAYYACVDPAGGSDYIPFGPSTCDHGGSFVNGACDPHVTECETICDLGRGNCTTSTTMTDSTPTRLTSTSSGSSSSTLTSASSISTLTTLSSTSSSSSTTPSTTECTDISSFNCPRKGYFARCPFCDPSYFYCDSLYATPTQGACTGDLVFNPKPEYPYCILPGNCPYHSEH